MPDRSLGESVASNKDLRVLLQNLARKYPSELVASQLQDVPRIAFHIGLIVSRKGTHARICDLGGGLGLFSVACAALGMETTLIDDFADDVNRQLGASILDLHKSYGVQVISRDVIMETIDFPPHSLDVVTCFDSMEHWHHSPKRLFASVRKSLASNGLFVLSVPNRFDLGKRLMTPLGMGAWS